MKIILMASWALPDLIFLTCTLLEDLKVTCTSFLKIMGWKIIHDRSPQVQLVMATLYAFCYRRFINGCTSLLDIFLYSWLFPCRTWSCRQRLGDGTSIAEMSSCLARARWVVSFVQLLFERGRNGAEISWIIWILIYNVKFSHANNNPETKLLR